MPMANIGNTEAETLLRQGRTEDGKRKSRDSTEGRRGVKENRISEEKKKGRKKRKTELENFCNNRRIVTGFVLYSKLRDPVFCTEILRE